MRIRARIRFFGEVLLHAMPRDQTLHHVDNVFGDIRRVIGNALQVTGYRKGLYERLNLVRVRFHSGLNMIEHLPMQAVNLVVPATDLKGEVRAHFHESVDGP